MKGFFAAFLFLIALTGGVSASPSHIVITPPQVIAWPSQGANEAASIAEANSAITSLFSSLEMTLNSELFNQLSGFKELNRGFANANAAAWDNATLNSFQTYDLFAAMLGGNMSLALPSMDPNQMGLALSEVFEKGDLYLGAATGGVVGQFGFNTGFLSDDTYISVKFGAISPVASSFAGEKLHGDVVFQQGMFGIGANYTIWNQFDFLFGFIKWRGLSFGTGFTYNANTTTVTVISNEDYVEDVTLSDFSTDTITATLSNNTARLTIDSSSLVIPLEVMTSLQAFWFFNVGLGAGLDITFPSARIKVSGNTDVGVTGLTGAAFSAGSVHLVANDSTGYGDLFVPRLMASLGLNLTVLKLDFPISYYPTTKATALGLNLGIVW